MNLTDVLPVQDTNSSIWFDAAKNEKLLLQRDPLTGKSQFYPRAHVLGAPDREPEWHEASGKGTLYSYTVVHRSIHPQFASFTPFVIALVDLDEGVRMTSWLVDVPLDQLRCDMKVKVVFRDIHKDLKLPCFTGA
ncbi:hypothetical protein D3C76_632820 [compost metagenome]